MTEVDDRPTKVCPDCAETVLQAARKCRFCGYRFDGAAEAEAGGDDGMLSVFRRRQRSTTVPQVLANWGFELEDEERVDEFQLADIDGVAGFVLITDERLVFFRQERKRSTVVLEQRLSEVQSVELVRVWMRHKLHVVAGGADFYVGGLVRGALVRLHDRLSQLAG